MRVLVLGGTGLMGIALMAEAKMRGFDVISAARTNTDIELDLGIQHSLQNALASVQPELVINAAANVNLAACERDPEEAYSINAKPAQVLANWSQATARPFVQISTDHFFDGDGAAKHLETAEITICNEYARTKYAAETYALTAPKALVLRTNIAGHHPDGRGFSNWALHALHERQPLTLFDDFFCSTIDTGDFAHGLFDLLERNATGLLHLASSEVSSKLQFVHALAAAANIDLNWATTGSVTGLQPPRARSLGLDVSKAEVILGRSLPGLEIVAERIVNQWRTRQ